jgi:hypothetical protein
LKCFHIAHFAIFYVVKSNISRYFMSSIRTFRDTFCRRNHQYVVQASKKMNSLNHHFPVRRIRSSKNTISLKRMSRKKSLMRSFQYARNEMIMISQIMCQYRKRCYESLCDEQFEFFASSRIRELSYFSCSKVKHEMKLRMCSSMSLWVKFVFESNYLNLFCAIHVLNFRCDLFFSSISKNLKRLISFVHFIDVKEFNDSFQHKLYSLLYILCCTSYQISSFIKTMIVSWNFQRQNVDRLFYFARDFIFIISIRQKMTSKQRYLKQREWIDFCVRRQNLLQKTMKRIWTWIKNDCSWQKFHKNFVKFEENYFDLIFIVRQIHDMKRMTKKIMSHIAII